MKISILRDMLLVLYKDRDHSLLDWNIIKRDALKIASVCDNEIKPGAIDFVVNHITNRILEKSSRKIINLEN